MTIDVTSRTPRLARYIDALEGPERGALLGAMGFEVQLETTAHLRRLGNSRHTTAQRLGASPTGFLSRAADQVESPAALALDARAAVLTVAFPGVTRAFGSITIRPLTCQYLAIPLNALAYGRRPREMRAAGEPVKLIIKDRHREGGKKPRKTKSAEEAAAPQDIAAFVLVRSVTQQQDRSLLPSDAAWATAARRGATRFIEAL